MTFSNINVGVIPNDHTGDPLRDAMITVNYNFSLVKDNFIGVTDSISISQITNLQTILDDIYYNLDFIGDIQSDIVSINNTITIINDTLNDQNISILDLYDQITSLQTQINSKISEAPIDGNYYVRRNATWSIISGNVGATGATGPTGSNGANGATGSLAAGTASGVQLSFITDRIYGSITSPETGLSITATFSGALLGVTNILIHAATTSGPTFSSDYRKLSGSGVYSTSSTNYIYCSYMGGTQINYAINQIT